MGKLGNRVRRCIALGDGRYLTLMKSGGGGNYITHFSGGFIVRGDTYFGPGISISGSLILCIIATVRVGGGGVDFLITDKKI